MLFLLGVPLGDVMASLVGYEGDVILLSLLLNTTRRADEMTTEGGVGRDVALDLGKVLVHLGSDLGGGSLVVTG